MLENWLNKLLLVVLGFELRPAAFLGRCSASMSPAQGSSLLLKQMCLLLKLKIYGSAYIKGQFI
jgi:hypothetical protein